MSRLVRVFCPECDGASADYRLPPCGECHNQGHLDIDRNADGTTPTHWKDGAPVRLYVDAYPWPDIPPNPLILTSDADKKRS